MANGKGSKRYRERVKLVDSTRSYSLKEAIDVFKQINNARYDESVAIDFQLGIKATSGSENVRGTVALPHGSGKSVRIICFCKGPAAAEAEEAGADHVGAEELVEKVQGGWSDFDVVVAHPDMMREVSKLGRILGPRGLMPTPKTGTVTPNVGKSVKELKGGRIEFKSDKTGGLHAMCGKLSFSNEQLLANAEALVKAVKEAKPVASKGEYLKSVSIAATNGPGMTVAVNTL